MDEMMQDSNAQEKTAPADSTRPRKLYRSIYDRRIAGVCGGIAVYFGVDAFLVRILWVVSCFIGFVGVFGYFVAWIIIPESPGGEAEPRLTIKDPANRNYVLGVILLVFGVILLADRLDYDFLVPWHWTNYIPHWLNWGVVFSIIIIVGGLALIMRQNRLPGIESSPATAEKTAQPAELPPASDPMTQKQLTRSINERMIGGVCGGIAKYFKIDPALVRIGWVLMTISGAVFLGVVAYIIMMIVVPEEPRFDEPQ